MITDDVSDRQSAPDRPGRGTGTIRRWLTREPTLVVIAGFALSALLHWEIVLRPKSAVFGGRSDSYLQAWELAWNAHFLTRSDFWTANILYPAKDNFAFTDSLLGYLPLSVFGDGPFAAVMRYNIAYIIAFALAFIGCYWLVRQLGGNWQAAAFAGVVFAWAPWRLAHEMHLNILSTGGMALALFAMARGHGYSFRGGMRPELAKPWWAFAGWLIAAWQVTISFSTGIPFVYLMTAIGVVTVVVNLVKRRTTGIRLSVLNGAGMVVFLGVTYLMTIPYMRVVEEYKFTRSLAELQFYSPTPKGLITASDNSWLRLFTDMTSLEHGERLVYPGLAVILLALVGLVVSAWPKRIRIILGISSALVVILSLGTNFFGGTFTYLLLWENLPGWEALRTPGRLIIWAILLLALLAAGAITRIARLLAEQSKLPPVRNRKRLAGFVLVLPILAAILEGVPTQGADTPRTIPAGLRQVFAESREPVLILPIQGWEEFDYMLWSTDGFPLMVNGMTGNLPPSYEEMVDAATTFPDFYSTRTIKKFGVTKVVVLKDDVRGTRFEGTLTTPVVAGLPVTRTEFDDVVVFTLR